MGLGEVGRGAGGPPAAPAVRSGDMEGEEKVRVWGFGFRKIRASYSL